METTRQPRIRISLWLSLLQWILVRYVRISPEWIGKVRAAASNGPILFVVRNRSLIDFLCLRGLMRKHGLPEVGFVTGLSPFVYLPLFQAMLHLLLRKGRSPHLKTQLKNTVAARGASLVFLRRPAIRGAFGSRPAELDGIKLAVAVQGEVGGPLSALPTVFLWGESAMQRMPGTMDFLFGSNEYPRVLRAIWLLLIRRSVHDLQVGPLLDVAALRAERNADDDVLTGVLRAGIGKQIEVIRRAKLGALTKPSTRVMTEVMMSKRLRAQLEAVAASRQMSPSDIDAKAWAILKRLAANFHPSVVGIFGRMMTLIWKRIYTGIDISRSDIEKIRSVLGERATLMLPSHKSHIDYLVLSQVMKENNLMMPHVAAGQNLAFWPLGWIFRSSGAFFIRRRFIEDKFYTAVVSAYIRRLILEQYAVEIFIEGSRSRTGKLLRPKTGLLEMALKAVALSPGCDINVLPIHIGYEQVIEERAYIAESEGKPKKAENITGLIRTTTVLFKKFGMLHVRVGTPFSAQDLLKSRALTRADLIVNSTRRSVAAALGTKALADINRITVVTASAILSTVILSEKAPVIRHDALISRSRWLAEFLSAQGATLSSTVQGWLSDGPQGDARLDQVIRVFVKSRRIARAQKHPDVYNVLRKQRSTLDYYKNNTIHFLVPAALAAQACCNRVSSPADLGNIRKQIALSFLLYRHEFILNGAGHAEDASPQCSVSESLVDDTLSQLVSQDIIAIDGSNVVVTAPELICFLADVLRNFHEVYFAAISAIRDRVVNRTEESAPKQAKLLTQRYFAEGFFTKREGHSILNQKSAFNALKALGISRPGATDRPFEQGALGDRLYRYLEKSLQIEQ